MDVCHQIEQPVTVDASSQAELGDRFACKLCAAVPDGVQEAGGAIEIEGQQQIDSLLPRLAVRDGDSRHLGNFMREAVLHGHHQTGLENLSVRRRAWSELRADRLVERHLLAAGSHQHRHRVADILVVRRFPADEVLEVAFLQLVQREWTWSVPILVRPADLHEESLIVHCDQSVDDLKPTSQHQVCFRLVVVQSLGNAAEKTAEEWSFNRDDVPAFRRRMEPLRVSRRQQSRLVHTESPRSRTHRKCLGRHESGPLAWRCLQ